MMKTSERTLLFLTTKSFLLKEADRFLSHRGWTVRMHGDMKDLLKDVMILRPRYVFMSVDVAQPQMASIRKLIEQIYKVTVIDFAEEQSLESWGRLKALRGVHVVEGLLTGPAIERTLARLDGAVIEDEITEETRVDLSLGEKLHQGTSDFMNRIFDEGDRQIRHALGWTEQVTCLSFETAVLSGYFLVALGGNRKLDAGMTGVLREAVLNAVRSLGLDTTAGHAHAIEIQRVEFKEWASEHAEFLELTLHQGTEVAIAFFPTAVGGTEPQFLAEGRLGALALSEIDTNVTLPFDLYLHLPLNGKFLLYVSKGGNLSPEQACQLEGKGISRLYFKPDQAPEVRREKSRQYFNRAVLAYYESRIAAAV